MPRPIRSSPGLNLSHVSHFRDAAALCRGASRWFLHTPKLAISRMPRPCAAVLHAGFYPGLTTRIASRHGQRAEGSGALCRNQRNHPRLKAVAFVREGGTQQASKFFTSTCIMRGRRACHAESCFARRRDSSPEPMPADWEEGANLEVAKTPAPPMDIDTWAKTLDQLCADSSEEDEASECNSLDNGSRF